MEAHRRTPDEEPPRRERRASGEEPPRRGDRALDAVGARGDRRRLVILIVAVVVAVGALVFWIQNHQRISISYLSVRIGAPLWLAVTGYFLIGVLVGVLLTLYYRRER